MAIIKSFSPLQNLSNYGTFVVDTNPNSDYFRITEFNETFTGGKNGFLIEGSEFLKETTEIKIEILDVEGNPVYYEPGDGIPEYYEGVSKLVSVHVYEDTPIGLGKITILGELKTYVDDNGVIRDIPSEWRGSYNLKWEKTFNINKNLNNETIVRFYKRPQITIDEVVKSIFSKTIPTITQSGSVIGISQTPTAGTNLSNWTAGTFYKLKISDDSNWTSSVDENIINIPSLGYSPVVREVLNNKEVIVDIPFANNNIVSDFTSSEYSTTFEFVEGQIIGESALTGSFAKINIKQLKTFVGDVARVKVYRKSRNDVGDFQFVQESKLESSELLRDITTAVDTEISYGNFTDYNLETYWTSSNPVHPISLNVEILNAAVKVDYDTTLGGVQQLITTEEFNISKDVEYTLSFKTLLSGSVDETKTLKAYLSSSDYQQTFLTINGSAIYQTRQNVSQNIIATDTTTAKLVFEYTGDDWYTSAISLKNAQETSFSPDEFILIQDIPRNLSQETFDFRFEFYDINNNYIPVDVTATKIFTGGNNFPTSGKLLSFGTDRTVFRFSSGSLQNPPNQQIKFTVSQTNLTGSVTFASSAFDTQGNYLNPDDYIVYPGQLTSVNPAGAILTIDNFTGSRADGNESPYVGSIIFTASIEDLSEFETVYRLEDGENAPGLFVTSDANQFVYKATDLSPNPANQLITFLAKRKNLESTDTPIIINSDSVPPLTLLDTDAGTGVSTFSLSIGDFPYNKTSPSASYYFTASDEFGNEQYDSITLSQVKILDGLSVTLSNDNASLPALSTGFVLSDSFVFTSGSVTVKVGNESIGFDDDNDGIRANNTFAITDLIGTGCIPNGGNNTNPTTNSYGITELTSDSGSLDITVNYKDGAGDETTIVKTVTYTKNKKAAPVLEITSSPKDQSVTAKSTGGQIDSFSNVTVAVRETYNGVTTLKPLTSLTATSSDILNISTTLATGLVTLSGRTLADGINSTTVLITAVVTDSEGISRTLTDTLSLSKVKKAVPNVVISATPQAQSVLANSSGGQTGTLSNVTVGALEGATSVFTSMVISGTPVGFSTPPTVTGNSNTLIMTSAVMNAAEGSVTLIVTHTDSEGSGGQTQTIIVRFTKVNVGTDGANGSNGTDSKTVTLTANQYTVQYNGDGIKTPVAITLTATQQNHIGTVFYQFLQNGTSKQNTTSNTYSIPDAEEVTANSSDLWEVRTREGSNSGTVIAFDNTDIFGIQDGTNAITAFLTNEAHTLPTTNTGVVTYTGSGTSVVVFKGTTELNGITSGTPTLGQFTVTTSVTTGTITVGAQTSSGNPMVFADHNSMNTNLAIIEYTINIENLVTLKKYQTLSKSIQGTDGEDGEDGIDGVNGLDGQNGLDGAPGASGPGIVFRGVWDASTIYFDTDDVATRRDAVLYDNIYYATLPNATTNLNKRPDLNTGTFWESLGAGDFFVAAKIAIFEESFVQNTINVGTNTGGNANITIAGGTTSPFISIGQSIKGYDQIGAFMGSDGTNGKLSLKSATNSLLWDGSTLTINGSGTFSGALSAASGTFTGALEGGTISIGSGSSIFRATTQGIWLGNTSFDLAPFRVSPAGALTATSGTVGGVTIASNKIYIGAGNFANTDTGFYVDNTGNFSLKDKLTWNGTTLTINGNGTFSGALSAATGTFSGALSAATGTFNGSIRIGSGTSVFTADTNGIYLGSETPTTAPFRVTPNGSLSAANANLTGNITATSGRIGNWIISGEGSLQNSNSKLKINPVTPGIEIYDQFNAKRLDMHFGPLTYLGAVSVTFTPPAITIPNVTLTGAVPDTRVYSSTSSTFSAAQAGTYQAQITFPSLGVIGQISDATNSYVAVGVGIEVRNTSGDAVAAYTTQFTDPLGASPGVQNIELLANTAFLSLNLPASGNYTVYSYYYYYAFIQSGVTAQLFSTAVSYSSITLDLENNLVEITNDGIQVATSAVQYLNMPRQTGGIIIDGRGRTVLRANSTTDWTLSCQNVDVTGDAIYVYATDRGIYVEQGTCWRTGISTWNVISDRRVKKNEDVFTGSLDIIKKLKPKQFEYINPADKGPNSDGVQVGFIAQDVEEIWPSWVSDGKLPSGSKDIVPTELDYDSNLVSGSVNIKGIGFGNDFFAMLVGSIQELSAKVEMLEAKLSGSNDSVN